jgi:hypothetical protein
MSDEIEFVRGKRLYLRELQPADLPAVHIAMMDWYGDTGYVTEDAVINFMRGATSKHNYIKRPYTKDTNHYETFAICLNATDECIGFRRIKIVGMVAEGLMTVICPAHRGKKYHTESMRLCLRVFFDVMGCTEYTALMRGTEETHPGLYWALKKNGGFMTVSGKITGAEGHGVGVLTELRGTKKDWDTWKGNNSEKAAEQMTYKGTSYVTPAQREENRKKIKLI